MRAILTYHSIDSSGSVVSVSEERFRRHVAWLAGSGVRVVSLEEIVTLPPAADAIALTFDDGFANFAAAAWPLLREHGFPVTLFVVSDRVGRDSDWDARGRPTLPVMPLLDWSALGRLVEEGVALGAHSRTHPDLRRVRGAALLDEVGGCAERIAAETGWAPTAFAYPFGACDAAALGAVRARFALACTTELRTLGPAEDPHLLPRLDAYYLRAPGRLESWGTPGFRRYLWLRARARAVRQGLAALGGAG